MSLLRLDRKYIERVEAVKREASAGISIYGYVGHEEMPEGEDFCDRLKQRGVSFEERIIETVGTWEDNAHGFQYQRENEQRYAYVLNFHPDVDVWYQSVYIFSQPVPDSQLANIIEMIRAQEKDLDQLVYERLREIDKEYPPYWGLINLNWQMSIFAYCLVQHGWTSEVEKALKQWGAYSLQDGVGVDNPLVQSLLAYGKLIMAQEDPYQYITKLLEKAGRAGRSYRKLLEKHPLQEARDRQKLSLRQLAAKMELEPTTVARWEQGKNVPTRLYAQALSNALKFESWQQVQRLCREWQEKHPRGDKEGLK